MKSTISKIYLYILIIISSILANSCQEEQGEKDGESLLKGVSEYYDNGRLKEEGSTLNGLKTGIFYYYNHEGVLEKEVNFKNDLKDGESKIYNPDGSIIITEYLRGYEIGTRTYFHPNGKIGETKTYIKTYYDSTRLNTWKSYDSDGNVMQDSSCYYEILNPISVIKEGDIYDLEIKVTSYHNEYISIYQCDYLEEYNQYLSPEDEIIVPCMSEICTVRLNSNKKGNQTIRMIILDFILDEDGYYNVHKVYFQYKYEVI